MARAGRLARQCTIERVATSADPEYVAPDADGTLHPAWTPIAGYQVGSPTRAVRFYGERQDMLPSRSESVQQGLLVGRRQVRWRMRWRDDVDASMRVTIHGDSDEVFQIVGGPSEFGGRKDQIELLLEKSSV